MLGRLSGRRHTVVSGVTLRTAGADAHASRRGRDVWFRTLTDEEIDYYIDTFRPFDKAGSYGIQEWIGYAAIETHRRLVLQRHGTSHPESIRRIG